MRCTCAEVNGEDPDCKLHGVSTDWALEFTHASEWQTSAIEDRAMLREAWGRVEHLQAQNDELRAACHELALAAAELNIAADGMEKMRHERTRVLAALKDILALHPTKEG